MKLFASDIDNTILPQHMNLYSKENMQSLFKLLRSIKNLQIAYFTGRNISLTLETLPMLPSPDFIAPEVGTSLYYFENNEWKKDKSYDEYLLSSKYNREEIQNNMQNIPGLYLQEQSVQTTFKLSYYLHLDHEKEALDTITRKIDNHRAKIIYSKDKIKNVGLVDIIPTQGGKAEALSFLINKIKIKQKDVVYAGDSGNDIDVFNSGFNSIIVGNASPVLKNMFNKYSHIYIAKHNFSKGIVEGINHFRNLTFYQN